MPGGNILVVEDDLTFRKWLKDTLLREMPRLAVREAPDGEQALKEVKDFNPRVVIMDIGLPGKNGIEITKAIKSLCPPAKFIFLTNYDDPEYRQAAEKLGVDCFLSKRRTKTAEIINCLASLLGIENDGQHNQVL
jgi:DNA-binding NarL/FixJ family response regulator